MGKKPTFIGKLYTQGVGRTMDLWKSEMRYDNIMEIRMSRSGGI